ncbi:hypothetical protein [Prosthecobacter fluviatilis]|uniref:Elongation factor Tu n=1 Tax=Prosthecobacter fluviatilis TaxID=445931 RepID=A0ABW0KVW7_9BACT
MKRFFLHLVVLLLAACSESKKDAQAASGQPAVSTTDLPVVVLGGPTCAEFVKGLTLAGVSKAQDLSRESLAGKAAALHAASVAVILVDATEGPLPVTREDVLLTRQFCRGTVVIGFSKSALVEDAELLDLEEMEVRDLLNKYDHPGDTAAVGFDSESARTKQPKGFAALAVLLSKMRPADPPRAARPAQQAAGAELYVLADLEAFKRGLIQPVSSGGCQLIFGDKVVPCTLQTPQAVQPGSAGKVTLAFPEPVSFRVGDRFVIGVEDHLTAAGRIGDVTR